MYILEGQRIRLSKDIYKEYPDHEKAVAEFEFDVTKDVAQYLALYEMNDEGIKTQLNLFYRI